MKKRILSIAIILVLVLVAVVLIFGNKGTANKGIANKGTVTVNEKTTIENGDDALKSVLQSDSDENCQIIYKGSSLEETAAADYEIVDNKLVPKFILTEKKFELYDKGKLERSVLFERSKLDWGIGVKIAPNTEYFSTLQAIAGNEKGAELMQYKMYNFAGDLLWEKESDKFIFVEEKVSPCKNGTCYFYYPDLQQIGFLRKDAEKLVETEWIVESLSTKDDKVLVITKDKQTKWPYVDFIETDPLSFQMRITLYDTDLNPIWKETYSDVVIGEPKAEMYGDKFLLTYKTDGNYVFVVKNYKNELLSKYIIDNERNNEGHGAIDNDKNLIFFGGGTTLAKANLMSNEIEKKIKLKGYIKCVKKSTMKFTCGMKMKRSAIYRCSMKI